MINLEHDNIIDSYLKRKWWVKENSNIDFSAMALNNRIAEDRIKQYWLENVYPKKIRDAYKRRLFHIHNLGHLTSYCVGWNLEDILKMGFKGQPGRQTSHHMGQDKVTIAFGLLRK